VATAGIEGEGTAYRMDGVPLRLSKLLEPEEGVKPDAEILDMIIERIGGKR
jgi:formylmethanofuran dehydrogenase subunit B